MTIRAAAFRWAAAAALVPLGINAERLPTEIFSVREGLHATVINRIVADSRGFIWMPADDGLARFDGSGFRIFRQEDGLPPGTVRDILERPGGSYWVSVDAHLCLLDPSATGRRFQCESPKLGVIGTVLEDESGLWCGTGSGLWRRRPGDGSRWELVSTTRPGTVHRILKDSRGDIWATIGEHVYRFRRNGKTDRWTDADGIAADKGTALAETPGSIWVGSQLHLSRFAIDAATGDARIAERFDRSRGLPSAYVVDICLWNGTVWAATFSGLARLLPSGRWQAVELDPSIDGMTMQELAVDSHDSLWVGTDGGGAFRVPSSGFSSFSERDGLGVRAVWAIFGDERGLIAVAKDQQHFSISRFDGYRFREEPLQAPVGSFEFGWSWSHIAVHSPSGGWWLGAGNGLLRYPDRLSDTPQRLGPREGLPLDGNVRVFEDSRGAIWTSFLTVNSGALYRRAPGETRFEQMGESRGLRTPQRPTECAVAFAEDRLGQIWIGTLDEGVLRFRDGKLEHFDPSTGAPDQGVRSLLIDHAGRLWIGSLRRGLLRVDDPGAPVPSFRAYSKKAGLASDSITALAEDRTGRIYAATGFGIDRLDPGSGRIRTFGSADGVPVREFRVAATDRDGSVWFGGDSGLLRLQPRADRVEDPRVVVYSIRVNGRDRMLSDFGSIEPQALSLISSERQVQVRFGGFRHDLLYQTKLFGIDADWTVPSSAHGVHYLALAPGAYHLAIRAIGPDGSVSTAPAHVRFQIAAPLWQRWWFLLGLTSAIAALLFWWHRSDLERRLAIERIRFGIATDLHDHIGASLSRIAMTSEVLKLQAGTPGADPADKLGEIAEAARGLVEDMSDIVWSIDPRRDTVGDLAGRLRAFGFAILEPRGIRWTFDAPEDRLSFGLTPGARRHLYLILKEALHNVARHSRAENASLTMRFDHGEIHARVADDGCGCENRVTTGLGIRSMQSRAKILGGELDIRSRPEGGTTVSLRFPLRATDA